MSSIPRVVILRVLVASILILCFHLDATAQFSWYRDQDGDGYGDPFAFPIISNQQPVGYAAFNGDCSDQVPSFNPTAVEIINDGIDNDCDSLIDLLDTSISTGEPSITGTITQPLVDLTIQPGQAVSFSICVQTPLGIAAAEMLIPFDLPPGATFNGPSAVNPTTTFFGWTPTAADVGVYRPTFVGSYENASSFGQANRFALITVVPELSSMTLLLIGFTSFVSNRRRY